VSQNNHLVFVNNNIDGATSFLLFKWLTGKTDLVCKTVSQNSFPSVYNRWSKHVDLGAIDKIYVFDLDVTKYVDMIPADKLVIIDSDPYHDATRYKPGTKTFISTESGSCSRMIYDMFNNKFDTELTKAQKVLMLLVDDCVSYNFSLSGSYELGLIFDNYQGDRVNKFLQEFINGFEGFTVKQKAIIGFYKNKINDIKKNLEVFESQLTIGDKKYKFISTFTGLFINEISDWLLNVFKGDISIVINVDSNRVSFRRSDNCTVDLSKLSKKLADGGGKQYSAGGYITDKLLELSKTFKQIK
jgi:hypothetical protein